MPTDNRRAKQLWKRFVQTYGARFLDQFGKEPSAPWIDALDQLTDEQVAFGLRKVTREHVQHPPSLGAFEQACNDLPVAQRETGPSIQEQLCAYATLTLFARLTTRQLNGPWTYLYREGVDAEKPKHLRRTAECVGLVIDPDGDSPGHRIMVVDMQTDAAGHAKGLRSFKLGHRPNALPPPSGV